MESSNLFEKTKDITYDKVQEMFENGVPQVSKKNPLFIIKFGPPGSGKTHANSMIYKMFSLKADDFVYIDMDNAVESSLELRNKTVKLRNKYCKNVPLLDIPEHTIRKILYDVHHVREKHLNEIKTDERDKGLYEWGQKDKAYAVLQRAMDLNHNIMFDSTGSARSRNDNRMILNSIPPIYKIVVFYPINSIDIQRKRTSKRASEALKQSHPQFGRFRMPDGRKQSNDEAKETFEKLILPMMYSGLIYKIIMHNNEEDIQNWKDVYTKPMPEKNTTRYNPMRIGKKPIVLENGKPVAVPKIDKKTMDWTPNQHKKLMKSRIEAGLEKQYVEKYRAPMKGSCGIPTSKQTVLLPSV